MQRLQGGAPAQKSRSFARSCTDGPLGAVGEYSPGPRTAEIWSTGCSNCQATCPSPIRVVIKARFKEHVPAEISYVTHRVVEKGRTLMPRSRCTSRTFLEPVQELPKGSFKITSARPASIPIWKSDQRTPHRIVPHPSESWPGLIRADPRRFLCGTDTIPYLSQSCGQVSEVVLNCDLKNTCGTGVRDLAEIPAAELAIGIGEVHDIENVECFDAGDD